MPGAAVGAARQLQRLLAELDRPLPRRRFPARDLKAPRRPCAFTLFSDPLNRYEFQYPAEWALKGRSSPTASSATLGLFVRVDLLPPDGPILSLLAGRFPGLTIRAWREGLPSRAEGTLTRKNRRFAWTGDVFELRGVRIALCTGRVEDKDEPATLRAYRRNILSAVRRHFRLSPGLRST